MIRPIQSEAIDQLAAALAVAQGEILPALADSENPHFRSRYADLSAVWDACRGPLSAHGLSVSQAMMTEPEGCILRTTLMHASGQWIAGEYPIVCDLSKPQALGSCVTYARRYSLAAIVGISQEDDDANTAQAQAPPARERDRRPAPPRNGNGHASAGPRRVTDPPREGPPRGEVTTIERPEVRTGAFRDWAVPYLDQVSNDWRIEISDRFRVDVKRPLMHIAQLANHLAKVAVESGVLKDASRLDTDGKRDTSKVFRFLDSWMNRSGAVVLQEAANYADRLWRESIAKMETGEAV